MTTRPHLSRGWSFLLFVGFLVQTPLAAAQQPQSPSLSRLPSDVRSRLAETVRDCMLAPWQRELMQGLVEGTDAQCQERPFSFPGVQSAPGQADGDWLEILPSGRWRHTAIYDPVRDRMVVFGGSTETGVLPNDVLALSLSGSPTWNRLTAAGTPPSGRFGHTAFYDPVRNRMVVFGGATGYTSSLNDVWILSLGGTPTWSKVVPAGTPPSARREHTAIYDPVRNRMVVFGGWDGTSFRNDVWTLSLGNTPTWSQITPSGSAPSPRSEHMAIYDPVRDRMVVFGGLGGANDVWELTLSGNPTWGQLTPTGTPPEIDLRGRPTALYDPVRDRMVVFGGRYLANDVWELSLSGSPVWSAPIPAGTSPTVHWEHTAIYDPVRDRMVVFGGMQDLGNLPNEVWALSLSGGPAWGLVVPQPTGRFGHTAIYDPVRDRMVVFGGNLASPGGDGDGIWVLSLGETPKWRQIIPAGTPPSPRSYHTAIYDPLRDRMVLFGGWDGHNLYNYNDVWALSLGGTPTWTELTPVGTPPSGRFGHTAIYDPLRDRMVVFGGWGYNDVWALTLGDAPTWTPITPGGAPPPRGSTAIYDPLRDRMVVVNGDWFDPQDAVWTLSLSGSPAWSRLNALGTPPYSGPERPVQAAIYDPVRDRMAGFAGIDVWVLSLSGSPAWSAPTPGGVLPPGREVQSAIYHPLRDRIVVFGGVWQHLFGSDVWALEWGTPLLPPRTLTAAAGVASITLRWTPSPSQNVVGYRISYGPVHEAVRYAGDQAAEGSSGIEVPARKTSLTLTCLPDSLFHLVVQAVGGAGGRSGWSQEVLAQPQRVGGTLALTPSSLGPSSHGRWVSAVLEPSSGFTADHVVVGSLRLNEVLAPERAVLGDGNANGVRDLTLKFSREQLVALLPPGKQAEVRVTGRLLGCRDTLSCVVRDTIQLIQPGVTHPVAGVQVAASSMVEISWTLPSELAVDSVLVRASVDNQRTWAVAGRVPAGRSVCEWRAPAWAAESCYVAVVAYQGGGEVGTGYGGPFRVTAPVAVTQPTERFGLEGARPHPFRAGGVIAFGVPQASAVSLRVFDLRGRLVETLVDGPMPAGRHEVAWDAHGVAAGVYFLQLRSGLESEQRRLVVLGE